jgi:hypothetical protein
MRSNFRPGRARFASVPMNGSMLFRWISGMNRCARRLRASSGNLASNFLTLGLTVIIEWGTWGRSERDALRLRARELGVSVELHYLSGPVEVLLDRVQRRGMENPPIEREQLLQWANAFQDPTAEEQTLFDRSVRLESLAPLNEREIAESLIELFQRQVHGFLSSGRITAYPECAGLNRHVVGVQVPAGKEVANPS